MNLHKYRILVLTLGSTPQIVTETAYHLITYENWTPTKIILFTTAAGEHLFQNGSESIHRKISPLLGKNGKWIEFISTMGISHDSIQIEVIVPNMENGKKIQDIRSQEEVSAFADKFLNTLRYETANADTQLHVSMAGGRKTMSYIAGVCLSMTARKHDELSHVLVEPQSFEHSSQFWWPTQAEPREFLDNQGQLRRAQEARIDLHRVPFIELGDYAPKGSTSTFTEAVTYTSASLDPDTELIIDTLTNSIKFADRSYTFTSKHHFAIFLLAAYAQKERWTALSGATKKTSWEIFATENDNNGEPIYKERYTECLALELQNSPDSDNYKDALNDATKLTKVYLVKEASNERERLREQVEKLSEKFGPYRSRTNSELRDHFPGPITKRLIIGEALKISWNPDRIKIIKPF